MDIDGVLNLESSRNEKVAIYGKEKYFMNDIYGRTICNIWNYT